MTMLVVANIESTPYGVDVKFDSSSRADDVSFKADRNNIHIRSKFERQTQHVNLHPLVNIRCERLKFEKQT